jgi:serine phosphatase RsbU (regulator of sigma subunit)
LYNSFDQLPDSARFEMLNKQASQALTVEEIDYWGKRLLEEAQNKKESYWEGMGWHFRALYYQHSGNFQQSLKSRRQAIYHFSEINRIDKVARQYLNLGNIYANQGRYDTAMYFYQEASDLATEGKDSFALVGSMLNISTIYHEEGKSQQELEYLLKAIELAKASRLNSRLGSIYFNLAIFYHEQDKVDESKEALSHAVHYYKRNNDLPGLAGTYNLKSSYYTREEKYEEALQLLDSTAGIYKELGYEDRMANVYLNQGQVWGMAGKYELSRKKSEQAYEIFKRLGEKAYQAIALHDISAAMEKMGELVKAIEVEEEAIAIMTEIGNYDESRRWQLELARLYGTTGNYERAFKEMDKYIRAQAAYDSLNHIRVIEEMEARYQHEKQSLEINNLEKERSLQAMQINTDRLRQNWLIAALILALLLITAALYAFYQKKKDHRIIQLKNNQLAEHKEILELKNEEILASITYAKRIQDSILPPIEQFNRIFPESFIIYFPKDIVAGDFYWLEQTDEVVFFAAADCTGHGVPGALVSVVCSNALNRSVNEYQLHTPAAILNNCRKLVISQLSKSSKIKDGMDISLCAFNSGTLQLQYAGAYNPLWIVSESLAENNPEMPIESFAAESNPRLKLYELKGDKQPVGSYEVETSFTNHSLQLSKGDCIYLFSDGFADQFGGVRGKKFKYRTFKELILEVNAKSMVEQKQLISEAFLSWKGNYEQIDDVCVIGVKV